MQKVFSVLLVSLFLCAVSFGGETSNDDKECPIIASNGGKKMEKGENGKIKKIIEKAYIEGIHINQDEAAVKTGFHNDFNMLVPKEGNISKVTIASWLKNLEQMKAKDSKMFDAKTTYNLALVDVTGNAAVVKTQVFKDSKHIFTDYMLLYKFGKEWKIVSKIFNTHNSWGLISTQ